MRENGQTGKGLPVLRGICFRKIETFSQKKQLQNDGVYFILKRRGEWLRMKEFLSANDPRFFAETDSKTIQNALDAAAGGTVRTVVIPRFCERTAREEWVIEQTLLLPDDVTVVLDDCRLVLAENVYQNIFRNRNMYTCGDQQHGIHIVGRGNAVLDGGIPNDLHESTSLKDGRPHVRFNNLILLNHVTEYSIRNITCRNMRYWAINQIACTHGSLSDIHFESGTYVPNQDGINFRIGCSHCSVEHITGQTGDDTVALSAFPLGGDRTLLPPALSPDIHDITIRDVSSCTHQTIVALRNTDGAKLYNITIENIRDNGGEYRPWAVLRIGEPFYFRNRLSVLGETTHIRVDGVHSLSQGTVFLNVALQDTVIRNVQADGTSMYAISTFYPLLDDEPDVTKNGITLEDVTFESIHYNGSAGHCDSPYLNLVGSDYDGAAMDFRCMRKEDTLTNVVCRNVTCRAGAVRLAQTRSLPIVFAE